MSTITPHTSSQTIADLFATVYLIRRTEEEIERIYPSDKIKSPVHLSIGQEAVAAGVCQAMAPSDLVCGTYRSHASYLAKGGDLRAFWAELYGKVTGCARGKGGSMHMIDLAHGVMGTSAIVGSTIAHAVGLAHAQKMRRSNSVVAVFFGDGATEEGVFHEALNFAQLRSLPVIFVCENNGLAIQTRQHIRQAQHRIWERASLYGIESSFIADNNAVTIHEATRKYVDDLRGDATAGPRFLECVTSRWRQHVGPGPDFHFGYRTPEELEPWFERDEVKRLGGMLDAATRQAVEQKVEADIADAIQFAEESPFPPDSELLANVVKE